MVRNEISDEVAKMIKNSAMSTLNDKIDTGSELTLEKVLAAKKILEENELKPYCWVKELE